MEDNTGTATIDNNISDARVLELVEIEISARSKQRMKMLHRLIHGANVTIEKRSIDEADETNQCVWGFTELRVQQPQFHQACLQMLEDDRAGEKIWQTGTSPQTETAFQVYTLMHRFGVKPCGEVTSRPVDFMSCPVFKFDKETLIMFRHWLQR